MTRIITLVLLGLALATLSWAGGYFQTIPAAEVRKLMGQPGVTLLDVNVPEVWESGHLPGAVHVAGSDLTRYLPADKKALLVFYCANPQCSASAEAADQAVLLGYRRVYVMPEGIFGWVRLGYPTQGTGTGKAPAHHEGMKHEAHGA